MKYQCNSCGKVYDYRSDAVNCHPDINEIPDEQLESRLAVQLRVNSDPCSRCGGEGWVLNDGFVKVQCPECKNAMAGYAS